MLGTLTRLLVAASLTVLATAQAQTPKWIQSVENGNWVNWAAISSDAKYVLAGSFHFDKKGEFGTYCFDSNGALKWKDPLSNAWNGVFWVAFSQDSKYGASGGWLHGGSGSTYEGFVRAYDINTGARLLDYKTPNARVNCVALNQDGTWLVAGSGGKNSSNNTLWLFKRAGTTFAYATSINFGSGAAVNRLSISNDGQWIFSGLGDGRTVLHQNAAGSLSAKAEWKASASVYVNAVAMTPDAHWMVAGLSDGNVQMFEKDAFIATKTPSWTYLMPGRPVYGVALSPDGAKVAAASNGANHQGWVSLVQNRVLFVPTGGHWVELAGGKRIWIPSGFKRTNFPSEQWKNQTDHYPNPGLSIDGSGTYLVAADGCPQNWSADNKDKDPATTPGNFYLYNIEKGTTLWKYPTAGMNWPVAISENGKGIVGGSDNGHVYYWQVNY